MMQQVKRYTGEEGRGIERTCPQGMEGGRHSLWYSLFKRLHIPFIRARITLFDKSVVAFLDLEIISVMETGRAFC